MINHTDIPRAEDVIIKGVVRAKKRGWGVGGGGAAERLLIPSSFKQPRLIERTPLIFGLFHVTPG